MFFSIIVPVYKTEKYIQQCIESVLAQSFQEFELMLVDDGSPDQCGEICDMYGQKDKRIRVIHKENGGLSEARNAGIRSASGDYILFLDSDDYWNDADFLEKLRQQINQQNCDVMNYHYQYYYEKTGEYRAFFSDIDVRKLTEMDVEQRFCYLTDEDQYIASACNKAVSRRLIMQDHLYFRTGVTSEDIEWCARLAVCCKKMGGCNLDAYCYRQREESITHTVKPENIDMLRKNIRACVKYGKEMDKSLRYREAYFTYIAYQYGTLLFHINYLSGKVRTEQMKLAKPYQYLLKYGKNGKVTLLRRFNRLFGFRGMNVCLRMYVLLSELVDRKKGKRNG